MFRVSWFQVSGLACGVSQAAQGEHVLPAGCLPATSVQSTPVFSRKAKRCRVSSPNEGPFWGYYSDGRQRDVGLLPLIM